VEGKDHSIKYAFVPETDSKALEAVESLQGRTLRIRGKVVHGFNRGSKLLGMPTANLNPESFEHVVDEIKEGVYAGFVSIGGGPDAETYKTAVSVGRNPHFQTVVKTVEPYILHKFEEEFYGADINLMLVAYIRPQAAFKGLEDLIAAIDRDVRVTHHVLGTKEFAPLASNAWFQGDVGDAAEPKEPVRELQEGREVQHSDIEVRGGQVFHEGVAVGQDGIYDNVDIADMDFDPDSEEFSYLCPCGDRFRISYGDIMDGEDVASCPSCPLKIRVLYPDDFSLEEEEDEDEDEEDSS
jgi:hypothetical protein